MVFTATQWKTAVELFSLQLLWTDPVGSITFTLRERVGEGEKEREGQRVNERGRSRGGEREGRGRERDGE